MASFEPAKVLQYTEGEDPKKVVFDALGDALGDWPLFLNQVLVVTAPHPEKSKGGLLYVPKTMDEERFQGKVGLVVKLGELAFDDETRWPNEDTRPKIGDWVFYRNADTSECSINGISCRFILDDCIKGRVPSPKTIR